MPTLVFVQPDGARQPVSAIAGRTAMEAARAHGVRGIKAECGGECSCSTCHCYVDEGWRARLAPASAAEAGLVEFAWEPRPTSRLACQIIVTPELDGLVLHVPARQL